MNTKVSIILPSLNVVNFIEDTLTSVVNQSLREIEIICVDAHSTDGTDDIIKKMAAIDSRIKLVYSDKRSYGYQVNLGMSMAISPYVAIVDTDDIVPESMYEELYELAIENDLDFIKTDYQEFVQNENQIVLGKRVSIVDDVSLYGKIVSPRDEVGCFRDLIVASWSGIYKRSFLEELDVCHNETPGASYQDTGFTFLAYANAKRAMFLDKAYYLYRTDNPGSSIKDDKKMYCLCDEFSFILNRLKNDKKIDDFKSVFCRMFYEKYKWNLERLSAEKKAEFIKRFSQDYNNLVQMGAFSDALLTVIERDILRKIMIEPEVFIEEAIKTKKAFYEMVQKQDNIIIYGAGDAGVKFLNGLEIENQMVTFAVTKATSGLKNGLADIPVSALNDLVKYRENSIVIVAVKVAQFEEEMTRYAKELGFTNVVNLYSGFFAFA